MENKEIWKDVVGYEGLYQVSNWGRVVSLPKELRTPTTTFISKPRILKCWNDKGYRRVCLNKNEKGMSFFVHRLVAYAFLGVREDMTVNHKDENKSNNHIDNLEYLTNVENIKYGTGIERSARKRRSLDSKVKRTPVNQYTLKGEFIKRYPSITKAKEENGFKKENISLCCLHKRHHSNGYIWRYDGDTNLFYPKGSNAKIVIQYDLNGNKIAEFKNARIAEKETGTNYSCISECCHKKIKTANGYIWRLKNE